MMRRSPFLGALLFGGIALVPLSGAAGPLPTQSASADLPARCDPASAAQRKRAYHLIPEAQAVWRVDNELQRIRISLSAEGVRVLPLGPGPPPWEGGFSLARYGEPDDLHDAGYASVQVMENRLDLVRSRVGEWFQNGPKGLEHGVEIPLSREPGPLYLDYRLAGSLSPKVSEDGQRVEFRDGSGAPVLIYRDLRGVDVEGRDVSVRWERREGPRDPGGDLRLVVEGRDHAFPIHVMGLLSTRKGWARSQVRGRTVSEAADMEGALAEAAIAEATVTETAVTEASVTEALREAALTEAPATGATIPETRLREAAVTQAALGDTAVSDAAIAAAPANDQCGGAEVIPTSGPFPYLSAVADITNATTTGDPPVPSCQANVSHSVWFAFTPATSTGYTFSVCSGDPTATTVEDTVLAIYSAAGICTGFAELTGGCDDDSCPTGALQSVISSITLTAGTTYYIVASKYDAAAPDPGAGSLQLRVVRHDPPGPAPPNDLCSGSEVIPGSGPFPYLGSVTADISGATNAGDPPSPSCQPNISRSLWYVFTPVVSGRYTFSVCANAPTGTTVDDTVMAIYAGTGGCSGLTEVAGGCDDDSCTSEAAQSVLYGIALTAGTNYHIVVWQYGTSAPAAGNIAVQLRVIQVLAPPNDTCASSQVLSLDSPVSGTTVGAVNDTQLPDGSGCFIGVGQTASVAAGGDVAYRFTAPATGRYSFRLSDYEGAKNAVLYVAADCPSGVTPLTIAACLGAANRSTGSPEEVACLPLSAGQTVYAYVDEVTVTNGSTFTLEVNRCWEETEPNGLPSAAGALACGIKGSITPAGDIDFYALGAPEAGARVFAMVDGAAGNSTDFDLRVTTDSDTLEYDDLNNDVPFGPVAPNVSGTPLNGSESFLRVTHYSAVAQAEPYRLYAAIQPPSTTATPEVEPNGTLSSATGADNEYYSGRLSDASDVDFFSLSAVSGEMIQIGLDLDPARNNSPFNGSLALLNSSGATLMLVSDPSLSSSTLPGTGSLSAKNPSSPGEAIAYRIRTSGTYYVRVTWSSGTPGDYLLSISHDCRTGPLLDSDGDGVPDVSDCAPANAAAWSVPGEATSLVFVAGGKTLLRWFPPSSSGGTVVRYDLLRSTSAGGFPGAACLASDISATSATDSGIPVAGFYYLVRSENVCGGNLGKKSDGTPRAGRFCP